MLQRGQEPVKSDPHSGSPATSRTPENAEHIQAAMNKDQPLTVRELEADLGIPNTTVSHLMQGLGMKEVVAKFVPQLLLPEQKEHHTAVNNLIQTATKEPDFLKVITTDKSWVYGYDLKQRPSCPNGSHLVLHARRRHFKVAAKSRPC